MTAEQIDNLARALTQAAFGAISFQFGVSWGIHISSEYDPDDDETAWHPGLGISI